MVAAGEGGRGAAALGGGAGAAGAGAGAEAAAGFAGALAPSSLKSLNAAISASFSTMMQTSYKKSEMALLPLVREEN